MFNICWEYLNIEDFDYGNKITYPLLRYTRAEWLNHVIASDPDSLLSLEATDLAKAPKLRDLWLLRAANEGKDQTVA